MSMKNSNDTIGNRTSDIPYKTVETINTYTFWFVAQCLKHSAVPQALQRSASSTAPPRALVKHKIKYNLIS
jgi:hypothetical protein